jgi:hypothetical protein
MADRLRLLIEPPEHRWTSIRLTGPGVDLTFHASGVPQDSLGQLAAAANRLMAGETAVSVFWNTEPEQYEFRLSNEAGKGRLEVHQASNDDAPTVEIEVGTKALARAIWRAFRRLEAGCTAAGFQSAWGHPFPGDSVNRLGERLISPSPISS